MADDEKPAATEAFAAPAGAGGRLHALALKHEAVATSMVQRPCQWCWGAFLLLAVISAFGQPTPSEDTPYDWFIPDCPAGVYHDALTHAKASLDTNNEVEENKLTSKKDSVFFVYSVMGGCDSAPGGLFSPERLQEICVLENVVRQTSAYEARCPNGTVGVGGCMAPSGDEGPIELSLLSLFYPDPTDCTLLAKADVDATAQAIVAGLATPAAGQYAFFVDAGTLERGHACLARSMLPADGDQAGEIEDTLLDHFGYERPTFGSAYQATMTLFDDGSEPRRFGKEVETIFYSRYIANGETQRIAQQDTMLSIGAVTFVYSYMFIHTGSWFVALGGLVQIILSLPLAFVFFYHIFGVLYFSTMNILVIYLILGIGADNTFVFHDYLRALLASGPPSDEQRASALLRAWRREVHAVFNTATTTAIAFVATAISPIMPIASFGIYAGIAMVVNYVLSITWMPCVCAVWMKYHPALEDRCKRRKTPADGSEKPGANGVSNGAAGGAEKPAANGVSHGAASGAENATGASGASLAAASAASGAPQASGSAGTWPCLAALPSWQQYADKLRANNALGAKVSVAVLVLLMALFAVAASGLQPPQEAIMLYGKSHTQVRFREMMAAGTFTLSELKDYSEAEVIFGIAGVDREATAFSRWTPDKNRGVALYDDSFDLSKPASRRAFVKACEKIEAALCESADCIVGNRFAIEGTVTCIVRDFEQWYLGKYGQSADALSGAAADEALREYTEVDRKYEDLVPYLGFVGGKLRWATIPFRFAASGRQGKVERESIQARADELAREVQALDASLQSARVTGGYMFWWIETENALVNGLMQGCAICFPACFFVVLLSTRNAAAAGCSMVSIAGIVLGVFAFCQLRGWELGVIETIAGIITIGFSVDFTLHLGHAYMESTGTRDERFGFMLDTMGATVLAGAATTAGAGLVQLPGTVVMFPQMGQIMAMTMFLSVVYSFGLFANLLLLVGKHDAAAASKPPTPGTMPKIVAA